MGDVRRISPEAPVPVLEVTEEDKRLGMAANVAQNVVSLGGEALLLSVVGDDTGAQLLKDLAVKNGVRWDYIVATSERPTTRKTRVMAKHHHIVRVDYEVKKFLAPQVEAAVVQKLEKAIQEADIVIIEDYAKGVITQTLHELDQIQLAERWIIDGFGPLDHLQQRFSLADKIVLIDLPLRVHYFWAVKRIIGLIFKARPELPIGAQELRLDHLLKLFDSIKKYHRLMRPELLRILARPANSAKLVHINSVSNLNLILSQGIE